MELRTLVTFRSDRFTIESKLYYINPYKFGDDVAKWLPSACKSPESRWMGTPGQEDFGWYLGFHCGSHKYHFVLGYNADGYWLGWLERKRGFVASLLGARKRGIQPDAENLIDSVLSSSEIISDVHWHFQKDFDALREDLAKPTPLG
jgi:hypothetical protein